MSHLSIFGAVLLLSPLISWGAPTAATPSPKPSSKQSGKFVVPGLSKRVKGVAVTPAKAGVVSPVISPKPSARRVPPPQVTYFSVQKSGPGKLTLTFNTSDPRLELNDKAAIAIQLNTEEALQINPSIIMRSDWPAGANSMPLSYTGGVAGRDNLIQGKGAYTVCDKGTKECHKVRCLINYSFKP